MSECYTIRRLKWVGDYGWHYARQHDGSKYQIRPKDGGYLSMHVILERDCRRVAESKTLTAAKAACWDDWVKRLEPALVRVRGKKNK